jgi:hypothetical protein
MRPSDTRFPFDTAHAPIVPDPTLGPPTDETEPDERNPRGVLYLVLWWGGCIALAGPFGELGWYGWAFGFPVVVAVLGALRRTLPRPGRV